MNSRIRNYLNKAVSIALLLVIALSLATPTASAVSHGSSYIVTGFSMDAVTSAVQRVGGTVVEPFSSITGVEARLTRAEADLLACLPDVDVFPDSEVMLQGDDEWDEEGGFGKDSPSTDYPDVTGADLVWEQGVTGEGVTVAILDTGIGRHIGLLKGLDEDRKTRIVAWLDLVDKKNKKPFDPNGHGTHIAGIIANSQTGADGEWNGMAPGVDLVGIRVLDKKGKGTYKTVIKAIDWVIEHKDEYNIKVMNMSLVAAVQSPYWADPLNKAIMRAWAEGITVVVAAGNTGSDPMTVGVPGNNPYVITAGAFTDNYTVDDWSDDYIAPFSSAGPTLDGFVKPDVMAPGAHMVSTMLPNSYIAKSHDANRVANQYFSMAGTSQAAGVVSGIAALMLANNGGLSPDEVKYRVMYTSFPWTNPDSGEALYSVWQQGAGRVNAPDAVFADISGSANYGMDIHADLDGAEHYQGYSYFDESDGLFKLYEDEAASGSYGLWSGSYGLWSGSYGLWSGSFGLWSGSYGLWSGSFGLWSGSYGLWSGSYGLWSGSYGLWSGGYGTWAGGPTAWTGAIPWAGSTFAGTTFANNFLNGAAEPSTTTNASISNWVTEPKKKK